MSQFDKDLKPGDLIFALEDGVHRVLKIERRFYKRGYPGHSNQKFIGQEYNSLIHHEKILTKDMRVALLRGPHAADSSHCSKIDEELLDKVEEIEINEARAKKKKILEVLKESEN